MVYGVAPGTTEVFAFDDKTMSENGTQVTVVAADGRGAGDKGGKGFPRILVSGDFDRDPYTDDFVTFSADDPPVSQRPEDVDHNIWWINSAAPLARLYLDKDRGFGYQSREWRIYHIERFIEVMVQIHLMAASSGSAEIPAAEWAMQTGYTSAKMQEAVVSDLVDFIDSGKLPGE